MGSETFLANSGNPTVCVIRRILVPFIVGRCAGVLEYLIKQVLDLLRRVPAIRLTGAVLAGFNVLHGCKVPAVAASETVKPFNIDLYGPRWVGSISVAKAS